MPATSTHEVEHTAYSSCSKSGRYVSAEAGRDMRFVSALLRPAEGAEGAEGDTAFV
jgi:hypothetical protein